MLKIFNKPLIRNCIKLYSYLTLKRKNQLFFLLILTILTALSEMILISISLPFLNYILNKNGLSKSTNDLPEIFSKIYDFQTISFYDLSILFIVIVLCTGFFRILLSWSHAYYIHIAGSELSRELFRKIIQKDYDDFISNNSSQFISSITFKTEKIIHNVLSPLIIFFSSLFILFGILLVLIFINPFFVSLIFVTFIISYAFFNLIGRRSIRGATKIFSNSSDQIVKVLNDSFGSIREIALNNLYAHYEVKYNFFSRQYRLAQAKIMFYGYYPKFCIEVIFYVLITLYIVYSYSSNLLSLNISLIAVFTIGLQRFLPLFQQAYNAFINIISSNDILIDFLLPLEKLSNKKIKQKSINFRNSFEFVDLFFKHHKQENFILKNLNLTINKGDIIGIKGPSGSGKTSFINIFMGFLKPTKGIVRIDGKKIDIYLNNSWQEKIAFVPQEIFLFDDTLLNNIVLFKSTSVDYLKITSILDDLGLNNFVSKLPNGLNQLCGERGINFSGGQRQRIAIARALFLEREILIMDEATSALDVNNERHFVRNLTQKYKNLTIIIISHRSSTLEACDIIYEIKDGSLKRI